MRVFRKLCDKIIEFECFFWKFTVIIFINRFYCNASERSLLYKNFLYLCVVCICRVSKDDCTVLIS